MLFGVFCESVLEAGFGVDAIELRGLHDRVYGRCTLASGIRTSEEVLFLARAMILMPFSAMLLSISSRPSMRNRLSASRRLIA
jgi:hypothetical protein